MIFRGIIEKQNQINNVNNIFFGPSCETFYLIIGQSDELFTKV